MSTNYDGTPVPPEGAHGYSSEGESEHGGCSQYGYAGSSSSSDAQYAAAASATSGDGGKKKKKDKKSEKKSHTGLVSFFSGVLGAVVVCALVAALWSGTSLLDGFKSGGAASGSNGTITIDTTEDTTTAEAVAAKCLDSVVTIYVYSESSSWNQYFNSGSSSSDSPSALGSGVIISVDGDQCYILTNYHVLEDVSRAVVKVGDEQYEASPVGYDSDTDLAVIKITASGLTAMEWGDSDEVNVGEWVMAIGSPYGYEQTCTTGIVSALYRSDVISDSTTLSSTVYTDMIQTDAAINPGNSGGALVNAEGQLIGINTYISSTSESSAGLGFAIPSSEAREVAEQLINGETVDHAFLGIALSSTSTNGGVEVAAVYKDTAAAEAGLQTGDIITAVDGKSISSSSDVQTAVSSKDVGDTIEITYTRNGNETTVTATLGSDNVDTSEYAENGEPATSDSGSSGNGYSYGYGDSGNDGSGGSGSDYYDLLGELFGFGSSDSGSGSGSGSGSSNGFWD